MTVHFMLLRCQKRHFAGRAAVMSARVKREYVLIASEPPQGSGAIRFSEHNYLQNQNKFRHIHNI